MSFNFDKETINSWKTGKSLIDEGVYSATLLKCEIIQSKAGKLFLKWFFLLDELMTNIEKISALDGRNANWTRKDLEYVSKQEIQEIESLEKILPLITHIPCRLKIIHKDGNQFINIIKNKENQELFQ